MIRATLCIALLSFGAGTALAGDEVDHAVGYLVEHLDSKDAQGEVTNASAMGRRRVTQALTCFLLSQDTRRDLEDSQKRLEADLSAFLLEGGAAQESWLLGFTGIWLGEKGLREDVDERLLDELVYRIERNQNREGGWGHGMAVPLDFYPSTLVAASNFSLLALGLARRTGADVDPLVIRRGVALFEKVQGHSGAMPYGGLPYRKGYEAGRTTGTVAALAALAMTEKPLFHRAAEYVLAHPAAVPHGHASGAMHVLTGALCFYALGDKAWELYQGAVLDRVRELQRKDGSFPDLLGDSPDSLPILGGEEASTLYITACYAAALSIPDSRVGRALRLKEPLEPADRMEPETRPEPAQLWRTPVAAMRIAADGTRVLVASRDGKLRALDASDGHVLFELESPSGVPVYLGICGDRAVLITSPGPGPDASAPLSTSGLLEAAPPRPGDVLTALDVVTGQLRWSKRLDGRAVAAAANAERVVVLADSLSSYDLSSGSRLYSRPGESAVVNADLAMGPEGRVALAAETSVALIDPDGREVFRKSLTRRRGISPAVHGSVALAGKRVVVGRSDGVIVCFEPSGKESWRTERTAGIAGIDSTRDGVVLLVTDQEGAVLALRSSDGEELWRYTPAIGPENPRPQPAVADGAVVLVPDRVSGRVDVLDVETGKMRAFVGEDVIGAVAGDGSFFTWSPGGVRGWKAK